MKKIILYGLNDDRKNQIKSLFSNDITIKYIDKSYLEVMVGDIFDRDEVDVSDNKHDNSVFNNEFMLIQGFDGENDIRDLLYSFKSKLVARPITSARTESNEKWLLKDLFLEIFDEHQYMTNLNK
ncbi:PF12646 domain protein [Peptostreptococcaceae bacterium AS15]|nr:PF12646 domain protein [Peptostreptococcaceae bacterium AS15]